MIKPQPTPHTPCQEIEAIMQSSERHRKELNKLWMKIEDLDAAIQQSKDANAEAKRKLQARSGGNHAQL